MSKNAKPPKRSGQVIPFPKQWRPPCLSSLPKGKQRWLMEATRKLVSEARPKTAEKTADAIRVSVALAFASNRRGEVTEPDVLAWVNAHPAEVTEIAFALVEEMAPEAAREVRLLLGGRAP